MALDGFFINKLIKEIEFDILNSRLEKVLQVDKDLFCFSFYLRKNKHFLYFKLNSPNGSFYITDTLSNYENHTSNLLNSLKQNLEGYILKSIEQYKNDRVVTFNFEGNDLLDGKVNKKIIVELMGRHNNLILLNSDNIIIDAYHKKFNDSSRSILPKLKFEYFPNNKLDFDNNYISDNTPNYFSKKYIGFSPLLSKYLVEHNSNVDLDSLNVSPTKNLDTNKFYWFNIFNSIDNIKTYNTLSSLLASSITVRQLSNNKYINFVNKEIIKYTKLLETIESKLALSIEKLSYKNNGDLIYMSGLNLNTRHSSIVSYDNTEVILDSKYTLNENAQKYYKLYQKAKRSIDHLENQIKEVKNNLVLLNQYSYDLDSLNPNYEEIEKSLKEFGFKAKQIKYKQKKDVKIEPLKIEYNEAVFYVGKNNIQNEYVTHTIAKNNDYWFHIKDVPGSHVILKGSLNDDNLLFGAMLAAKYSKEAENPIISINYTSIKNVKKIPGLKGYNVLLKEFNTINVNVDNELLSKVFIANNLILN